MPTLSPETSISPVTLLEVAFCDSPRVDREAGVIHEVKILGRESKNGRTYSETALDQAAALYEGLGVNIDHPDRNAAAAERRVADGFGHLRNVKKTADGVYGDLVYLKSHALAEQVCETAERMPRQLGLSHNAEGYIVTRSGKTIVEGIERIRSVDVVRSPATNRGLFESIQNEVDAARASHDNATDTFLDGPTATVAEMQEQIQLLEQESEVKKLLESNGLSGDSIKVRALMALDTVADRQKLIATWTTRNRHKPRSACRLTESTVPSPLPSDAKSFAQAIR